MQIESLLPNSYIIIFTFTFIILIALSIYFKVKNLIFRTLTFLLFLIILLNPIKDTKNKVYHKNLVLIVSDLSDSVIKANKKDQVNLVKKKLIKKIKELNNLEIINIEVTNNLSASALEEKDKGTLVFKKN